ncbi:putative phosphatidylserine decarboxylase, partial [Aspergillus steynii IBT 23096]
MPGNFPRDYASTQSIQNVIERAKRRSYQPMDPAVTALKDTLESDKILSALCRSMFAEGKKLVLANRAHPGYLEIDNIPLLMRLLDYILVTSPEWEDLNVPDYLGGLPFNLVLMVLMETRSGQSLFRHDQVNRHLSTILRKWSRFLESPESAYALNSKDGWLSAVAMARLQDIANHPTRDNRAFIDIFDCPDPSNPDTLGFSSWDAFFTRRFKPGIRLTPSQHVLYPGGKGDGAPILNACESTPWHITRHCSLESNIMLKGKSHSVASMLGKSTLTQHFSGGTVYQAYLSALSYHRWHAPVSGTIRSILYLNGSYFSQLPMSDNLAMEKSQSYLATVATRMVVFIEATDPGVGLMAFVAVGMGEVSSCEASVAEGDHVEAGDEIGCFHYGGSTHCLVFRGGVDVRFESLVEDEQRNCPVPVKSLL